MKLLFFLFVDSEPESDTELDFSNDLPFVPAQPKPAESLKRNGLMM